jgi:hypothetical protein
MSLFTSRRLGRSIGGLALAASTLAMLSAMAGAAGAAQVPTTGSVLIAAKAAIAKRTGVHLVVTSKSSSTSVVERVAADLGKATGTETISDGTGTVMIKVTPTYAYLSGNSSGLTKVVGLSAAEVSKLGSDWVSLKAGTSQYTGVAGSMTVSSVAGVLPAAKGTTLSAPAASGKGVYSLKWDTAATSSAPTFTNTLTLSAGGATLPIEEITTATGGARETVTLSHWGEHVQVTPPPAASTIPFSKLSS